eukprot:339300-Rhodomonas_salina.1
MSLELWDTTGIHLWGAYQFDGGKMRLGKFDKHAAASVVPPVGTTALSAIFGGGHDAICHEVGTHQPGWAVSSHVHE